MDGYKVTCNGIEIVGENLRKLLIEMYIKHKSRTRKSTMTQFVGTEIMITFEHTLYIVDAIPRILPKEVQHDLIYRRGDERSFLSC